MANKKASPTSFGTVKAVFWDRDGVLNEVLAKRHDGLKNVGPNRFEDFKVVEGAGEVLNGLKARGYLNIVITNQPDVSRNLQYFEVLDKMHDFLKVQAPAIIAIYVCPHTAEANCICRKPKPGMLFDAAKDYHIDLAQSYMVGDTQKDIDAGIAAGVKTILVGAEYNSDVLGRDYIVKSLKEILEIIK